jgi:hypothetical protein
MKKSILKLTTILFLTISFSGCAKYYSTSLEEEQNFSVKHGTPVKVEMTQTDWSIVVNLPDKDIKKNISDALFDNPVFIEDEKAEKTLKVDITHSNDGGGAEMANAVLTGASLYLIPGVADSEVSIDVSIDDLSTNYKGELIVAQGMGASAMIDKEKYTEDTPLNLMKNLIKNAINKFTITYLKEK